MDFFGVVVDSFSSLLVITEGLLKRGRPRFLPVLFPLTNGVSFVGVRG
jgi:hypothetical protein